MGRRDTPLARLDPNRAPWLTTWVVVISAFLVVPPVLGVIYSSFIEGRTLSTGVRTLENYRKVLTDPNTLSTISDTVIFALGTAVASVTLAGILAWLVERTDAPFRRWVYVATVIAFGVPTVIQGMGWILLLGPRNGWVSEWMRMILGPESGGFPLYNMWSLILIQSCVMFPAVFLLMVPAMRATDPSMEEAAAMSGANAIEVIRRITLPLVIPSVLAALLLAFILVIQSFEIPALIGTPAGVIVLSTEIYGRIRRQFPDYGAAASFSTLLMGFAIVGLFLYQKATARAHRFATVRGKAYRPHKLPLGKWRWLGGVATLLLPLGIVSPIVVLVWNSFLPSPRGLSFAALADMNLANYRTVLESPQLLSAARNNLVLGLLTAIMIMAITVLAAWLVIRRRSRVTRTIDQLVSMPLVVPGVVLSLAVLRTFIQFPIPIYGTIWIILIAFVIHYLPYGMRFSHAGLISLHGELEEAAAMSGAPRRVMMRRIVFPLMGSTLLAGGVFIFLATIRQLSVVLFLAGPGSEVVAMSMFSLWTVGNVNDVAAFATLVVAVVVVLAFILYRLGGVVGAPTQGAPTKRTP